MWEVIKRMHITLIDVMVVLAALVILAVSMAPSISGMVDEAKVARARLETQNIGMAILRFRASTGKWPARNANARDHRLSTLISGNSSSPVPLPTYARDGSNCFGFSANHPYGDYLDNHLYLNQPKGNPDNAYPASGDDRWNGSYLQGVGADPWGSAYVVNIIGAYDLSNTSNLYCYVLSAGPDGTIQTDSNVTARELASHTVSGDDVAFLLRIPE